MVDVDRIDKLIAAVPPALALRAGLDLGIFTRLGGSAASADSLGAALDVAPDRLSRHYGCSCNGGIVLLYISFDTGEEVACAYAGYGGEICSNSR